MVQRLTELAGPEPRDHGTWGPACPEPALRAWGQQFVNRLQSDHETRLYPVHPPADDDEEGEHVVIGRLIRRISHFRFALAFSIAGRQRSENFAGHDRRGLGTERFP